MTVAMHPNISQQIAIEPFTIRDHYRQVEAKILRHGIVASLLGPHKTISSTFFYDEEGSRLFEQITQLEEYYPGRTERSILQSIARRTVQHMEAGTVVEFGSGDCSKISILIDAMNENQQAAITYVPVDVSRSAIEQAGDALVEYFPLVKVEGVVADFLCQIETIFPLPSALFCFFGGTLGNLDRDQAKAFVANLANRMQPGDRLLLGMDMVKDRSIIEQAYNDSNGVTAAFNRNILRVVNRIIQSDFHPDDFEHMAFYDEQKDRIEMHLRAVKPVTVASPHIPGPLAIAEGETIHTENSHKYRVSHIERMAESANLSIEDMAFDPNHWFSVTTLVKKAARK